jgi:Holliday junction resolvase RusA-like endonuclease
MFIEGQFTSLNAYIRSERGNKYKANQLKQQNTSLVKYQVLGKKIETPCKLRFIWHVANRRTDPDNVAFAKKFVIDGLVQANVIPEDSMKYIIGFEDEFIVSKKVGVEVIPFE